LTDADDAAIGSTAPGRYGAVPAAVTLAETILGTVWNVQGDASRPPFSTEAPRLLGIALPGAPNTALRQHASVALWLGPTSWLLVGGTAAGLGDFAAKRAALEAAGGALFDVTASCTAWTIAGARAESVLAGGSPLDFGLPAFPERACAQSTFGGVNTLFYRPRAASFALIVARGHARAVWRSLCAAAAPVGYRVLAPRAFV